MLFDEGRRDDSENEEDEHAHDDARPPDEETRVHADNSLIVGPKYESRDSRIDRLFGRSTG